jgi:hypothetical protein
VEPDVVTRSVVAVALLLALAGCFDVKKLDPGPCQPLLIDDFDHDSLAPLVAGWDAPWTCDTFNPPQDADAGISAGCGREQPGFQGADALFVQFTVRAPPNLTEDTGAAVSTSTSSPGAAINFTLYKRLIFSAKLESGNPPLTFNTKLFVQLRCRGAALERPMGGADSYVTIAVDIGAQWATFPTALYNFVQPPTQTNHFNGGAPECLSQVDGISFAVVPPLPTGAASGKLHVDDIYLEPGCTQ